MGERLRADPYRWIELVAYCIPFLAATISGWSIGSMFGALAEALNLTTAQIGLLGSTAMIGILLFSLPAGLFLVRWDLKKTMTIFYLIMAFTGVAQGLATSFMNLLIYRIIYALAAAAVMPFYAAIKSRWFLPEDFVLATGIEVGVGFNLGQIIGVAITPVVVKTAGWQGAFLVAGALATIGALTWLILGKSYPKTGYFGARVEIHSAEKKEAMSTREAFKRVIKYKEIWLLPLGWWGTTGIFTCIFNYWPAFVNQTYGIDYTTAGFILSLLPVGSLFASLGIGALSKRVGLNKPFITLPTFLVCFAYFGMLYFSDPLMLLVSSFLAGFGAFAFVPAGMATMCTLPGETPEMAAIALSIFSMINAGIGGLAVPMMCGMLVDAGWTLYNAMLIFVPGPALLGITSIFCRETGPKAKWRQQK